MPLPVLSVAEMRSWEAATWATGRTPEEVIGRVGELLANRLKQLAPTGSRLMLLVGKGHNGDDVRAAVPHLKDFAVELIDCRNPEAGLKGWLEHSDKADLVVDGLFGIGLNRPLGADWLKLIDAVNQAKASIVAIDTPSGLCADSGVPLGGSIRASLTLTLGAPKRGLLAAGAEEFVGRLEVVPDIGLIERTPSIDDETDERRWSWAGDFVGFPPRRGVSSHKGTFGHVGIVAGSPGYHGAAVLCARGAQRAGAGLVTVVTPESVYLPIASQLQSAMVRTWESAEGLPENLTSLVIGPGLASRKLPPGLAVALAELWRTAPFPVVADASALEMIGETAFPDRRVITPHPGEAARLLGVSSAEIQANRPESLRRLSRRLGGCWVVLKGHQTLVGRSEGPVAVNSSGNPGLAQGGSGDVLAGFLGGLLAQESLAGDRHRTLAFAVWEHGAAADRLACLQPRWSVEELSAELGRWDGKTLPPAGLIC